MGVSQNIIAVIFDFDDTLTDDATTKLLESKQIDTNKFWREETTALTKEGWDPALAYLQLLLDYTGEGKQLGKLSNADLRAFGATLEFYPGIPQVFEELIKQVQEHDASRPSIEFFVVSGGLEEVMKGTRIAKFFKGIYGSRFAEREGCIAHVMNSVTFTEKTKCIFAINKGVDHMIRREPFIVNQKVDAADRRIPIENMIYIGDGLTDVPCFSVMAQFKGQAFGVFNPEREGSPKKAWEQLIAPRRVATMNSPRYGSRDDLGAILRAAVRQICLRLDTRARAPLQ
jgi:phosphoglycolate phosphatase-like HAD superfamily hydrolase